MSRASGRTAATSLQMSEYVSVQNLSRTLQNPVRIRICRTFACRFLGLMFRRTLASDEGLLLVGARDVRLDAAIHMLFVPFDLAVFWISGRLEVVDKVLARGWHPAYIPAKPARYVLEVHPQHLGAFEIGHKVAFVDA